MTTIKNQMWHCLNFSTSDAILETVNFNKLRENDNFYVQADLENVATYWAITRDNLNQFLSQAWIDQFEQKYMKINNCLIFFKQGGQIHSTCHIDYDKTTKQKQIYALNWCHGVDDAKMVWLKDAIPDRDTTEDTHSMYAEWYYSDVQKTSSNVEIRTIGSELTLVNTETPHYIEMGIHDRWCISIRLDDSNEIKNWNDAVDYFVE